MPLASACHVKVTIRVCPRPQFLLLRFLTSSLPRFLAFPFPLLSYPPSLSSHMVIHLLTRVVRLSLPPILDLAARIRLEEFRPHVAHFTVCDLLGMDGVKVS